MSEDTKQKLSDQLDDLLKALKYAKNERYAQIRDLQKEINGIEAAEMIAEKLLRVK